MVENFYESLLSRFPYQSTLRQYTIERQIETTLAETLDNRRKKLVRCYLETEDDERIDADSIAVTISSLVRLYLMRKDVKLNLNK